MKRSLSIADDLLLWGLVAVVAVILFGILGAFLATLAFAIKVFIVVVAVGLGVKVVRSIGSGAKRSELNR